MIHLTQGLADAKILADFLPIQEPSDERPTPADFGANVTVCIAAKSLDQSLVTVSDMMVSFDDIIPAADQATFKNLTLGARWNCLFAGNDIGPALAVTERAASILKSINGEESLNTVSRAVRDAYQAERREQITDRFLSGFGLSLEAFTKDGYAQLGHDEFSTLFHQIAEFDLGVQFLVYGLDKQKFGHIFTVSNPGVVHDRDLTGYWAIGSGQYMALGALSAHPLGGSSAPELIYRLCSAKFTAETASGVGKRTLVTTVSPTGQFRFLPPTCVNKLRGIWEEERKTPLPTKVYDVIKEFSQWT